MKRAAFDPRTQQPVSAITGKNVVERMTAERLIEGEKKLIQRTPRFMERAMPAGSTRAGRT